MALENATKKQDERHGMSAEKCHKRSNWKMEEVQHDQPGDGNSNTCIAENQQTPGFADFISQEITDQNITENSEGKLKDFQLQGFDDLAEDTAFESKDTSQDLEKRIPSESDKEKINKKLTQVYTYHNQT